MHRIAAILFALALTAYGENLYVTPTGAGASNGSDWSNAFAGFSDVAWGSGAGQLGAGDTLWVAGGTYTTQLLLNGSGTEGNLISIKRARATNSECASVTGWSAAYDSQAVLQAPSVDGTAPDGWPEGSTTPNPGNATVGPFRIGLPAIEVDNGTASAGGGRYCLIDGQVANGIQLVTTNAAGSVGIQVAGYGTFSTTFRNLDIVGFCTNLLENSYPYLHDVRCVKVRSYDGGGSNRPSGITLDHCTLRGVCTAIILQQASNFTVQYCDIHTIEAYRSFSWDSNEHVWGGVHQNLLYAMPSDNVVIRHNTFHDNGETVGLFFTGLGADSGVMSSNVFIYGNVFRDSDFTSSRWISIRVGADGIGPFYIYNNTFVSGYVAVGIDSPLNPSVESYIRNNLMVDHSAGDITLPGGEDYVTVSDNITTNSYAMFVSAGSTNVLAAPYAWQWVRDLHLVTNSAPINAGANLGAPYNTDMDGTTRGADGTWDVGAYECAGGGITPPTTGTNSITAGRVKAGKMKRK